MAIGTVFDHNNSQAVSIPAEVSLPEGVHQVEIRVIGAELVIAPLRNSWHDFFLGGPRVSEDFLPERASMHQPARAQAPTHEEP